MKPLKALKPKNYEGTFRPGMSPFITSGQDTAEFDLATASVRIKSLYAETIREQRNSINQVSEQIYGTRIFVKERDTSKIILGIKSISAETGKSVPEVVATIREYLGYPCSFLKSEFGRLIPVELSRIVQTYKAVLRKAPSADIKRILYN